VAQKIPTASGDALAVEVRGTGPVLMFILKAGSFRAVDPTVPETAERLASHGLTTVVYDRVGLGESTGAAPITLAKEIAALRAVFDFVGEPAVVCGHSSGSAIALHAATSGLPVTGLALWEVPVIGKAEEVQTWADGFTKLLEAGDHRGAMDYFVQDMPPKFVAKLRASPNWDALVENVQTMRADTEALAWFHSAPLAVLLQGLSIPVRTMVGETTFEPMTRASAAIVAALSQAQKRVMPGANHEWEVEPMVDELKAFVAEVEAQRTRGE